MPRREDGQLTIAELVVAKKDAFPTRHEPALHFDELERRLLSALSPDSMANATKVEAAVTRKRAARDALDDIISTGLDEKLR